MLLSFDVGTSSTRAALIDENGAIRTLASVRTPAKSYGVLCAEDVYEACVRLARSVLAESGETPHGIGVTAQLGVVLVDEGLSSTTDVLLWSNKRATMEAEAIAAAVPDVENIAGRRPSSTLAGPQLRWLMHEQPRAAARARWAISLKDYLVARLTGEVVTDEATASYSLLFDVARRSWDPRLLEAAEVEARLLPDPRPACAVAGTLRREVAAELGVRNDIVVAVGGPDGSTGVLGAGGVVSGIVVDVAGSTDVVLATTDEPRTAVATGTLVNAFGLPGLWTTGGTTPTTGLALGWLARLLGSDSPAALLGQHGEAAGKVPIGCRGLLVDPALGGARFPYEGSARSAIVGLTVDHGAPELVRGVVEGIAFSVLEVLELLERSGQGADRVRLVGGASQGWTAQLRADAWQREVAVMSCHEAALLGAALIAGVAAGVYPSPAAAASRLVAIERILEPRREHGGAFGETFRRWQEMKVALGARHLSETVPREAVCEVERGGACSSIS